MSDLNYKNFELLDKSFRLGTTSFIFPDNIIPNVKKLGPYFDEIELLIFESHPKEVLPSKEDINELLHLSQRNNLTYNIHLPIDVSLTCDSLQKRIRAKDTLLKVMDLFTPLAPTTHTLHLEMPSETKIDMGNLTKLKKWKDNACQGVNALITEIADPSLISIETLDYPFSLIEPIVEEFDLSVCIDAGHQIKFGYDLEQTFEKQKHKTPLIHLHGVDFSTQAIKDHTSLDKLPEKQMKQIQMILKNFTGVVSLEVFNLENLNRSMASLSQIF